jgi:citronellol/citronellal dehydrogenase
MPGTFASQLLRPGVLDGVGILLAGAQPPVPGSTGEALATALAELGARVPVCEAAGEPSSSGEDDESQTDAAVERALGASGPIDVLVVDAGSLFAAAAEGTAVAQREGRREALSSCLDGSWNVTRAVVRSAFLGRERGGRIVFLAPPAGSGEHAEAARAGLENLARTLSVEWARHAITVVAIAPGAGTSAEELAALTAYLASPAGAYFSGCLLDLSGPA